jgi:hypothetical protein
MVLLRVGAVCGFVQLSSKKKAVQFLVAEAESCLRHFSICVSAGSRYHY